jgi:two-component system chemotaxis family response regulator WspR
MEVVSPPPEHSAMSDTPFSILVVDPVGVTTVFVESALGLESRVRSDLCVDYAAACDHAARTAPTLVVVDISHPVSAGLDTVRDLGCDSRFSGIPVLAVIPPGQSTLAPMAFQLGAADVATKEMSPVELSARLRRLADGRRAVEERDAAYRVLELIQGELAIKNALLARTSAIDPLTGLASRRAFEDYLDTQWRLASESRQPLGLILVEVDRWHDIEEYGGTDAADEVLQVVSRLLRSCARVRSDVLARFGDSEFAFLLRDTDAQGVELICRRIVETMDLVAMHADKIALLPRATVSVGGASLFPAMGVRPEMLVARADEALSGAIHDDGNRFIVHELELVDDEEERRVA